MAQKFPYERASSILAECELFGEKRTAARWGITERTISNYRARASEDVKLSESFHFKRKALLVDWQSDATRTIKTGLNRLNELIPEATAKDADTIHAIAGAIKIVGELKIQWEALVDNDASVNC